MKPKFVLAVYTRKSKNKRIFETNDTIHSPVESTLFEQMRFKPS